MELGAHPSPRLNCSHQITYTKFWKESTILNFMNMKHDIIMILLEIQSDAATERAL